MTDCDVDYDDRPPVTREGDEDADPREPDETELRLDRARHRDQQREREG